MPRMPLVAAFLLLFSTAARSATAAESLRGSDRGEVVSSALRPVHWGDASRQSALDRAPGWVGFRSRYGAWRAFWNERTASPHRAWGPAIPLAGAGRDAEGTDRAVRAFVAGHPAVFGSPALERVSARRLRDTWYLRYRQVFAGVPVLFSDWEFRVGGNGALIAFGADAEAARAAVNTTPTLVRAVAREAATRGLAFRAGIDRVEDGGLYLLPLSRGAGTELRLVYDERVITSDPPGNWMTLVDARTGEVLFRHDRVRTAVSGKVQGDVQLELPTDPFTRRSMPDLRVTVGGSNVFTDTTGAYSASASGTVNVSAALLGRYCDVNNSAGADATFPPTSTTNPSTLNITWTDANSTAAERDAYYNVNVVHRYIRRIDPSFTAIDYVMPTAVNIAQTCNAYWDGTGINFFMAGGGCVNTATMPDVVFHEYGHGINDKLYESLGSLNGMLNGALHEGLADVNACFLQDDPLVGKGFFGPGTSLRTIDNTRRWPENASGDPHLTGLIIAGAFWDLRQAIGLATTENLAHYARYGTPDDPADDGVAMSEYFVETLVADDDDADLGNGTPHFGAIVDAFNAHGIGTAFFIRFTHTPLADQTGAGAYPVTATIEYTGPVGALDAASPRLHYRVNDQAEMTATMSPTGNPNEFQAAIPNQPAAIVHYWMEASDTYGASSTEPPVAPARGEHVFLAGATQTLLSQTMESDPGWTVGAPGDAALTGIWVRANPVGTEVSGVPVQPEDDHTPGAGTMCWVTGNGIAGDPPGVADIDGGKTTLTTGTFDATAGGAHYPVVEYYRWFSNDLGSAPSEDPWRTSISNDDGATWVAVENTLVSHNDWKRVLFFVHDYLTPTSTMKMRFVAQDSSDGSLVEAAVDDFRLLGYASTLAAGDAPATGTLSLAAAPNPAPGQATLRFSLPRAGRASVVVFDLGGRVVRKLADGAFEAGSHSLAWNGHDDAGRRLPSGAYFVRVRQANDEVVRKLVLMP